jgi:hypothetical protein
MRSDPIAIDASKIIGRFNVGTFRGHDLSVAGSDAADLASLMVTVKTMLPEANGGVYLVNVNKYLPARSWVWAE